MIPCRHLEIGLLVIVSNV